MYANRDRRPAISSRQCAQRRTPASRPVLLYTNHADRSSAKTIFRCNRLNTKTKEAPTTNPYYSVDYGFALTNLGVAIESVVKRGTRFAVCEMATRGVAGEVAMQTGGNADTVSRELVANTIPNSHMVAAGVLAVNRAQECGYTLLTAL